MKIKEFLVKLCDYGVLDTRTYAVKDKKTGTIELQEDILCCLDYIGIDLEDDIG